MTPVQNRVLNYHKIDKKRELGITVVNPRQFEKQIDYFVRKGYQFVTLSELFYTKAEKTIAITFDDAYQNIFQYAYPILKKYNIPATLFIITDFIGAENNWDVNLGGITYMHLSEDEIKQLIQAGWEIGSHSISHRYLLNVSLAELESEIGTSKKKLEATFDKTVTFFAPPFGKMDARLLAICKKYNYLGVCGFYPTRLFQDKNSDMIIPRLGVYAGERMSCVARKVSPIPRQQSIEIVKQKFINFWNNGTIIMKSLALK